MSTDDDWWYGHNEIIGSAALYSVGEPPPFTIIRARPIGFNANVDAKPIVRVKAVTRKLGGAAK